MNLIKNVLFLVCAALIVLLIPVFIKHDQPFYVEMPSLDTIKLDEIREQEYIQIQEEQKEKREAQAMAQRANTLIACSKDEECVIVDKHPCGCLVGPRGVTAINIAHISDFNDRVQRRATTASCPTGNPSTEGFCSPTAHAVCRHKTCRIISEVD